MNFNTFFLDKLSSGDQSPILNSKKTSPSPYLFSDIIKIYEQETAPILNSENGFVNLTSLAQGTFPLPENMIESDNLKLQTLSKFIENFIANSQQPVNSSEIKHDLKAVVISKKQFILSSQGLEDFINGLVQNLELNTNVDLKNAIVQKVENEGTVGTLKIDVKNTENQNPVLEEGAFKEEKSDNTLQNIEMMVQSILNFLSNKRSFNLSFKNGAEKVSINIYELPENNVETKINFEKLSADFKKAGNKSNFTLTNPSIETEAEKNIFSDSSKVMAMPQNPAEYFLSQSSPNDLVMPVQTSVETDQTVPVKPVASGRLLNENVYKTEVVEITLKPETVSSNLNANVSSNNEKLFAGTITLSGFTANDQADMPEAKFRLRSNLSTELSSLESSDKNNILATILNTKEKIQNLDTPLAQQNSAKSDTSEPIDKNILATLQNGKENIQNTETLPAQQNSAKPSASEPIDKNILATLLNGKGNIQNTETLTTQQNSVKPNITETSDKNIFNDILNTKPTAPNNNPLFTQDSSPVVKVIDGGKNELPKIAITGEQNKATEINSAVKSRPAQIDNQISNKLNDGEIKLSNNSAPDAVSKPLEKPGEINDTKILLNELSGKFAAAEFKKLIVRDENLKAAKDEDIKTQASNENLKDEKASVKETLSKSYDEKDFTKQKSNENFKSVLQAVDQISGNEADKFKIVPEVKLPHETVKVIKTPEIIPEFSKIIQAGEKQSVTFQLTPENLGKVKLSIDLVENQINTRIEVENEQVKQFIQSNIEQLRQNLQTSGIHLNNVNISLAESEQKFSKAFTPRKKSGDRTSKVEADEERTRPSQKSLGYNTYEFLA
jgi:flagellar hook-length control protein FliK